VFAERVYGIPPEQVVVVLGAKLFAAANRIVDTLVSCLQSSASHMFNL